MFDSHKLKISVWSYMCTGKFIQILSNKIYIPKSTPKDFRQVTTLWLKTLQS